MALPSFLIRQRWFGDKTQRIVNVQVVDLGIALSGEDLFVLPIVDLTLSNSATVRYFVPLALSHHAQSDAVTVAGFNAPDGPWWVVDAPSYDRFRTWFLDRLIATATIETESGRLVWASTPSLVNYASAARTGPSRLGKAEQSNNSLIYADAIITKVFRKLQAGVNPDVEVGRYLTTQSNFRHIPLTLGEVCFIDAAGTNWSLAVAQSFVPSIADGWSYVLESLTTSADGDMSRRSSAAVHDARLLGLRTGELHCALAGSNSPDFSPEPVTRWDAAGWATALHTAVDLLLDDFRRVGEHANADLADLIAAFHNSIPSLRSKAAGFERLVGLAKTRVHGDYHLGQTLRTLDDDFVILDFEGEPRRLITERRAKTSPLKDVAGMLRSFSYARGAARRQLAAGHRSTPSAADLVDWERSTRRAFLDGYLDAARAGTARFLPSTDEDFHEALAAWELDKAIYEVSYELNNRPDWLEIPLTATLKLV